MIALLWPGCSLSATSHQPPRRRGFVANIAQVQRDMARAQARAQAAAQREAVRATVMRRSNSLMVH